MDKETKVIGNYATVIITKKIKPNHEYLVIIDGIPDKLMSIVNPKAIMKGSRI